MPTYAKTTYLYHHLPPISPAVRHFHRRHVSSHPGVHKLPFSAQLMLFSSTLGPLAALRARAANLPVDSVLQPRIRSLSCHPHYTIAMAQDGRESASRPLKAHAAKVAFSSLLRDSPQQHLQMTGDTAEGPYNVALHWAKTHALLLNRARLS